MASGELQVNAPELGVGANSCHYAAESARKGAQRLAETSVESGIFGDFAAAHQFHGHLTAAHQHHQEQLTSHHAALTGLSDKANTAARTFTGADESAASMIDSAAAELG